MFNSKRPPNILWFTTDQQRFDTIGALGNPHVSTPTLDRLVTEGTCFTRAYCQSPICTPSRASFLTGMYPSTIRANRNGNAAFSGAAPLVTKLFADAGYVCGNVGKLHLADARGDRREARADDGYTVFHYSHAPHHGFDYADWVREKGFSIEDLRASPEGVPAQLHQTTWCAEKSIDFISTHRDEPWLLTVNPFDPHPPFDPPKDYLAMFDPAAMPGPHFRSADLDQQAILAPAGFQTRPRPPGRVENASMPAVYRGGGALSFDEDIRVLQAAYYAMIKLIDDQLARILYVLAETGQAENTLVVFTSDHGEMLGDHGLLLKGPRFYEGLVRVPLIFRMPGVVQENARSDALVELTDIAPTLLDLCGIAAPTRMHGRSLMPILSGASAPGHHRNFVRCEYFDAVSIPQPTSATMYRDTRHKLVLYHGHDFGELYDLDADPWEFDNLWASPAHAGLRSDLIRHSFDAAIEALDKGAERIPGAVGG